MSSMQRMVESSNGLVLVRRRTAGWTTAAGLAVLVGAALTARSWRAELPDPVAVHWGADGQPDGFSSLGAALWLMLGMGAGLVLLFGAITFWLGHSAWTRRVGVAATLWSALFIATLTVGSLALQRGLTDARSTGGIGGVLLLALAGSLVPAVLVAVVIPGDPRLPTADPVDPGAPRALLTAGESTQWTGSAHSPAALLIAVVSAALVIALVAVIQSWALLLVAAMLLIVVGAMAAVQVRVDADGVTIRSALGWPRLLIPLDEIVRADMAQARPVRDFGGWGWRVGRAGRVGVVLRSGAALLVQRTGDRSVVVTVDDARTAAGIVNAFADRARGPAAPPGS